MATRIHTTYIPLGIAWDVDFPAAIPHTQKYSGESFCDAIRQASDGQAIFVAPESLTVCRWAPVVLGLRTPDPKLNLHVEYQLPFPTTSVVIAPIPWFTPECPPKTVLVRAPRAEIEKIIAALKPEQLNLEMAGKLDRSALEIFSERYGRFKRLQVHGVNRLLAVLNRYEGWRNFTKRLFKHAWPTYVLNFFLNRFSANMSMCRNASVIPYLTQKANVSFFCTGGIAWGRNRPNDLVCGMPYELATQFEWLSPACQAARTPNMASEKYSADGATKANRPKSPR